MSAIRHVTIRGKDGIHYVCEPREFGWICGKCQRGNLGFAPKKNKQCKVCKLRVSQVVTLHDYIAGDMP